MCVVLFVFNQSGVDVHDSEKYFFKNVILSQTPPVLYVNQGWCKGPLRKKCKYRYIYVSSTSCKKEEER